MTIYTIRPDFTVEVDSVIYLGGEQVDLSDGDFEEHKHKLEGVESTPFPPNVGAIVSYPAPYLAAVVPQKILVDVPTQVTITGSFFTTDMEVIIDGVTVSNFEFISSNEIKATLITSIAGDKDLTLNNGRTTIISTAFSVVVPTIVDLRSGGDDLSNGKIRYRSNMTMTRDTGGVGFTGYNSFGSWVKLEGWKWNRSQPQTLNWIFSYSDRFAIGIGSTETLESATSQLQQSEITFYFSSITNINGIHGNNGNPGTNVYQSIGSSLSAFQGGTKKLVIEHNGEPGFDWYLYQLPSADINDWFDTSTLITNGTIPDKFTADAAEIMPFIIPRSSSTNRFLGFITY